MSSTREQFPEVRSKNYKSKSKLNLKNRKKATGIKALYFHYCFLLKVFQKNKNISKRYSKELKEEIKRMDKISNETRFLYNKDIKSLEELKAYKKYLTIDRKELKSKIESLYKKKKKTNTKIEIENINTEIKIIQEKIKELNYEIELVEDIEQRVPKIKENMEKVENENSEQRKEKIRVEHIK